MRQKNAPSTTFVSKKTRDLPVRPATACRPGKTLGDSLYWAEAIFLQNLLSDWSVRTTDPAKAKLFYVPTMFYYSSLGQQRRSLR